MAADRFSLYLAAQSADASSIPSLEADAPLEFTIVQDSNGAGGASAPALAASFGTEWGDVGFEPEHVAYASESLLPNNSMDTGFSQRGIFPVFGPAATLPSEQSAVDPEYLPPVSEVPRDIQLLFSASSAPDIKLTNHAAVDLSTGTLVTAPAASATSSEKIFAPSAGPPPPDFWLSEGLAPGIDRQESAALNNRINGAIQDSSSAETPIAIVSEASFIPLPAGPQIAGSSAASPRTPGLTTTWAGVNQSQAGGWNPPDSNIAAGTAHVITVVNDHIDIYNKSGASLYSQSLNTFFNASASNFIFDPRVMWDQFSGRFIVVADDQTGSSSHVHIAASVDSNPLNGWYNYDFDFKSGNSWLDYPVLGLDASNVYIGGNYFDLTTGNYTFSGLWAMNKNNLESGQNVAAWLYNPANLGAPYSDLYTSAHMYGTKAGLNGDFFVEYGQNNSGNDTLRVDRVENAGTGTANFNLQSLNVGNISDAFPAGARQRGTSTLIDDGDWRIQNAVWRADKLYAVTEIRVGAGASAHDVVHWFVVDTSNLSALTLLSQGNIDYGSDYDTYFGNLTVDSAGNMIVGYSFSGPGTPGDPNRAPAYASSVYAVIAPGGTGLADGGFYLTQGQGVNTGDRWGDYSGIAIDPTDNQSFWVFNEHATNSNSWATTVGGFQISQPGSVSISDASVTEGNSGTKVMAFMVTRAGGTGAFTVNFATSDGSATVADGDYLATAGTLNFGTTENTKSIQVTINGDTKLEPSETFVVNLSGATGGATISDNQGIGTILTDDQTTSNLWVSEGPAPGINGQENVAPNNQINGAIQAIAVHPTDPNIMYVGSVNGGIWKTTNATAAAPHWVPLTDNLPSLSIGALEFDPTDGTHQTLIAGIGSTSSYFLNDQFTGVLRSTNGGATWSQLGTAVADLGGENVTSVAARGATLLAGADNGWGGGLGKGLFRSTDTGAHWTLISDGAHGLPNSTDVSDIVGDPLNSNVFYAAVTGAAGGVFKSTDTGATWTSITSGIAGISSTTDKIELAVHHAGANTAVFATVDNNGAVTGVFRSLNGASFTALDLPSGGGQGEVHNSIAADPNNANIVYVGLGGGTANYLSRIDASKAPGSQITKISAGTFGSPHVDAREMQIDANGSLILGTDGGLFRLPTPTANTGVWSAIIGDISVFEIHSIAYDHVSNVIMAGTQDNGTLFQQTPASTTWDHPGFGDGGDVVIDDVSLAGSGRSIRYFSSQELAGWTRQVYDSANHLVSTTSLASITDGQFTTPVELNNVDPTRLLVGGSGHIYVSANQGTSLTPIANLGVNEVGFGGGGMMVYGGFQGAAANADLIYAASGANVLKQTAAGGGFTSTSPGGGFIRGITDNPTNWATVFAIDDNQVFRSTNAGATWVDVTANLTSISAADLRSIEYVHGTVDDALVIGTSSGVFYAPTSALAGGAPWSKFGANLPDVLVYDLEYDAADNVLVAGTMGRGAWLINDASVNLGIDSQREALLDRDFDSNSRADILWRHTTGSTNIWLMDGAVNIGQAGYLVGNDWKIQDTGDFDGDRRADILWRQDGGNTLIWFMNGAGQKSQGGSYAPGLTYQVKAVGDFDGDGNADILWRHDSGSTVMWFMNGGAQKGQGGVYAIDPSWKIIGCDDFDDDGKADILWRNGTNGATNIWLMNGGAQKSQGGYIVGLDWHVAGTGDFDKDGKADILWRNNSGDDIIWFMDGAAQKAQSHWFNVPSSWKVQSVEDFTGDGKADILWRHDTGPSVLWGMDGSTNISQASLTPVDTSWNVVQHHFDLV